MQRGSHFFEIRRANEPTEKRRGGQVVVQRVEGNTREKGDENAEEPVRKVDGPVGQPPGGAWGIYLDARDQYEPERVGADGAEFARRPGRDCEVVVGRDAAQPRDGGISKDHDEGEDGEECGFQHVDEGDVDGRDQKLVGERIEFLAKVRDLTIAAAGEPSVEKVRQSDEDEPSEGGQLDLVVVGGKHDEEKERNGSNDPHEGDEVCAICHVIPRLSSGSETWKCQGPTSLL